MFVRCSPQPKGLQAGRAPGAALPANLLNRRPAAGSLGNLLRAQIGYADRAQKLLLVTNLGRVQLFHGRGSLPVLLFQRLQLGRSFCLESG